MGTCGARELSVFWLSFQESDKMAVKQKNGYGWGKEEKDDLETNKCRNEMCEVHQKDSKWTEYLDFGPHGLSVIRNAGAHKVRVSTGNTIESRYVDTWKGQLEKTRSWKLLS